MMQKIIFDAENNITIPHLLFTSRYPPDILDRINRKSNRLRLKIVTKVNGKDVLYSLCLYNLLELRQVFLLILMFQSNP